MEPSRPRCFLNTESSEANPEDFVIGQHCIHRCSEAPLEGLCDVCLPDYPKDESLLKTKSTNINWKEASKSVVGWRNLNCETKNLSGDGHREVTTGDKDLKDKALVKRKSEDRDLPNIVSEASIMSLIGMRPKIEISVECFNCSVEEVMARMKSRGEIRYVMSEEDFKEKTDMSVSSSASSSTSVSSEE